MLLLCRYELYGLDAILLRCMQKFYYTLATQLYINNGNIFDIYMFNVLLQKLFVDDVGVETHGSRFHFTIFQFTNDLN